MKPDVFDEVDRKVIVWSASGEGDIFFDGKYAAFVEFSPPQGLICLQNQKVLTLPAFLATFGALSWGAASGCSFLSSFTGVCYSLGSFL